MDNINEINLRMAKFLGYTYYPHMESSLPGWKLNNEKDIEKLLYAGRIGKRNYLARTTKELRFNNNWDWLMSVVDKIEELGYKTIFGNGLTHWFSVFIYNHEDKINPKKEIVGEINENRFDAVYYGAYKFILWYNQQK